jgi:hypothetical protein
MAQGDVELALAEADRFRDVRRLPAFKDLLRDLGLVDYWRQTSNWGYFCRPLGDRDFECYR